MSIPVTAVVTALCALLLVGLATRVSQLRMRHQVSLGDGGRPELNLAIRLHANTVEHVPIFLLLTVAYELSHGTDAFLIGAATVFLAARATYTWGMLMRHFTRQRQLGAAFTYLSQLVLALALLLRGLS